MTQVSGTIPDHIDESLIFLSDKLDVSKSSLIATCIELGLDVFIKSLNDRQICFTNIDELIELLTVRRLAREKAAEVAALQEAAAQDNKARI
jgi:hypothetical protein